MQICSLRIRMDHIQGLPFLHLYNLESDVRLHTGILVIKNMIAGIIGTMLMRIGLSCSKTLIEKHTLLVIIHAVGI